MKNVLINGTVNYPDKNLQRNNKMKTKILTLAFAVFALVGLTSCHDDVKNVTPSDETYEVNLRSMALEVNNAEKVIPTSRASIDLSNFIVEIYNAQGNMVQTWSYGQMPEIFNLAAGDYKVRVRSHNVEKAAWEKPYFLGEKEFSVAKASVNEIGIITCKLSNIKVTIRFSDELLKYMGDDCKVTVIANDEGMLEFTAGETRSGYFAALEGSTTLVATFTGTVGGYYETKIHTCADVEAGQHRIITFKLRSSDPDKPGEVGGITPGLGIDSYSENENLNSNITVGEDPLDPSDRPGGESPDEPTPPAPDEPTNDITFTVEGADFDAVNDLSTGDIPSLVKVTINTPQGAEHLQVTISSTNENFMLAVSDLLPLSFDLAYPGDRASDFKNLGFPVGDEVIGATVIPFDISAFVPLLAIPAYSGTHSFQISVTDSKSQQLVKTLTFKS